MRGCARRSVGEEAQAPVSPQVWVPERDIPLADAAWNKSYGGLHAGPFNTGQCTDCDSAEGCTCLCYWPRSPE